MTRTPHLRSSCRLLAVCLLAILALAFGTPAQQGGYSGPGGTGAGTPITTVSGLSAYATKGKVASVTDGASASDCTTGGGSTTVVCQYTGSAWTAVAGTASMVYPAAGIAVSSGVAWNASVAAPAGAIVGTTDTQTLTNKTVDGVTPTVFGYIDPTSSIQTQLNAKAPTASPTFTGKVTTAASAVGGAGFNLPAGTAPTSPANGDLWTTTLGLYAQINGGTVGPFGTGGGGNVSNSGSPTPGQAAEFVTDSTHIQGVGTAGGGANYVKATITSPAQGQQMVFDSTPKLVNAYPGVVPNAQTGTTYTVVQSDNQKYVTFSNAAAIAVSLPSAATLSANFAFKTCNIGAGTATLTPTTSTISYTNGSAYSAGQTSMALTTGQCATVYSDNTNFFANITVGGGSSGLSGMTAGQVPIAATSSTVTSSKAIQGTDTSLLSSGTVSGTGATLCTDANGGATTTGCSGGSAFNFYAKRRSYGVSNGAPNFNAWGFNIGATTGNVYNGVNAASGHAVYTQMTTAATINTNAGWDEQGGYNWRVTDNPFFFAYQGLAQTTTIRTDWGFTSVTGPTTINSSTPTMSGAYFSYDTASGVDTTHFLACTGNAGAAVCTSTAVLADTNLHSFSITVTSGTNVVFAIDGTTTNTVTTNLPASTVIMQAFDELQTLAAAAESVNVNRFYAEANN